MKRYAVEYIRADGQNITRFVDSKEEGISIADSLKKEGARQIKVHEIVTVWNVIWQYDGENEE